MPYYSPMLLLDSAENIPEEELETALVNHVSSKQQYHILASTVVRTWVSHLQSSVVTVGNAQIVTSGTTT